jgi:mannitol/fructose-specific phosphotransferase system IIA component (Ntr-type)
MILSQILHDQSVLTPLESRTRSGVFEEMAKLIVASGRIKDPKAVRKAFESREKTGPTAVGKGVAIPHARTDKLDTMVAAIGIAPAGLDWPTPDGEPVRIVVALAGPAGRPAEHLKALSHTAGLLRKEDVRKKLVEVPTTYDLLQYLREIEGTEAGPRASTTPVSGDF